MKATSPRTLIVSLTPEQAERMQNAVDSGDYSSNSEIVRDALRLWQQREEIRAIELEQLRRAYAEGKASGDGETVDRRELLEGLKQDRSRRV